MTEYFLVVLIFASALGFAIHCAIILVRNELLYKICTRCVDEDYEIYHKLPSYKTMLYQWDKWTYKQFTKGLK